MNEKKIQGNIDWLKADGLALQDHVSCDTAGCEREATHYAHVSCCNAVIIGCAPCMKNNYSDMIEFIKNGDGVLCKMCGDINSPENWILAPQRI